MKATDQKTLTCYHCGEDCQEEILHFDDKEFCCTGCKLVYEVLQENDLCSYYEISDNPGSSQRTASGQSNRFDYLDDKEVIQKLLDFQNETESHITFKIPQIHCASCIWLLENLHRLNSGVISGRVDFIKKKVQIKYLQEAVSLKEIVRLLSKIGYEPNINLSDLESVKQARSNKRLIYRLAVAGFCFGNMMFFSLPEYFSEAALIGEDFMGLFNYLNVFLALPVFFYSASDYYQSAWLALKNKSINMDVPIVLGIFALFFYSLYTIFFLGEAGYMDTLGGLLFFLLIGKIYQQKTYETLSFDRDYKSYFPMAVTRMVRNEEEVIPLARLNIGDLIRIRNNELIPSDSLLIEGQAHIDYSFVTGEEVPVAKKSGELIYAGGRQKGASITLAVQKLPSQGYLTGLWNHESFGKEKAHSLESMANSISGKFTLIVLFIAFASLAFWSFTDLPRGLKAFTSVLIIACPCALAMSTPFTLGNTLRVFGKAKLYLKNAGVIERMAQIDTVVFDKTGTLTAPANASVEFVGDALSDETQQLVKAMVNQSIHPLSNRINSYLQVGKMAAVDRVEEISGKGLKANYKNQEFRLGSAVFTGASNASSIEGGNQVYLTVEGQMLGYFFIRSGIREGVGDMVAELRASKSIHLLSGDHGHERVNLQKVLGDQVEMMFQQGPSDKLEYVKKLNQLGAKTLMLGDGLNDAGALKESAVGIAVTDKVSHFSPASDAIMDAEVFVKLPQFLAFSKTSRRIIKASFGLSFAYNIIGISFAVQGLLSPVFCAVLMPLSSVSVILFTTVSTNYLAYKQGLTDHNKLLWK
ncbi:MAG TPA: heavy metal translocating P-type ATPase metal-binding domain-containing protein [Cyclobacteriaceae bacterium]|nr:heavy metal translocating P-type ATPase metal-binding domain-containing protein [Cyclobacteriaceae bacterium]